MRWHWPVVFGAALTRRSSNHRQTVEGEPVDDQAGELMADITVTQEH